MLALLASPQSVRAAQPARIKHVVVLFEENRAFDHFWAPHDLHADGLKGGEQPHFPLRPVQGQHHRVRWRTVRVDRASAARLFAVPAQVRHHERHAAHGWLRRHGALAVPDARRRIQVPDAGFSQGALPVSAALAAEYAVFDRWYTAFPGPSWPNHMMSYSATANGGTNTGDGYHCKKGAKYPQRTIFDNLLDAGLEYTRIFNDSIVDCSWSRSTRTRRRTGRRTWIASSGRRRGDAAGPHVDQPAPGHQQDARQPRRPQLRPPGLLRRRARRAAAQRHLRGAARRARGTRRPS